MRDDRDGPDWIDTTGRIMGLLMGGLIFLLTAGLLITVLYMLDRLVSTLGL